MQINGSCHCGNIRYRLNWPGDGAEIPARACGCSFCTRHAGAWTSHRDSELFATVSDESAVSKYRFGTGSADFYVCSSCGVVPFAISVIENRQYAVVNVNTFEEVDPSSFVRVATNFDSEDSERRLERRTRTWIRSVRVSTLNGDGHRY